MSEKISWEEKELEKLCETVKKYIKQGEIQVCENLIPEYMKKYPDSAVPHNLLGILLEKRGRHLDAMKHFRAASALDAEFLPANFNMRRYSSFEKKLCVRPLYGWADYYEEMHVERKNFFKRHVKELTRRAAAF